MSPTAVPFVLFVYAPVCVALLIIYFSYTRQELTQVGGCCRSVETCLYMQGDAPLSDDWTRLTYLGVRMFLLWRPP